MQVFPEVLFWDKLFTDGTPFFSVARDLNTFANETDDDLKMTEGSENGFQLQSPKVGTKSYIFTHKK